MKVLSRLCGGVSVTALLSLAAMFGCGEAAAAQLQVTWVSNSTNEAGFSLERKIGTTGTFATVATLGAGVTSYTDTSVVSGTAYCYRVLAFNGAGSSPYSNESCATAQDVTLTVTKAGAGSGTVTSSPAGIACGATCAAGYASGTVVTLTAAPAAGSVFGGWSGGGCTGTGTCTVTLSAANTVTATFTLQTVSLTVTKAGAGSGTVTSAPAGITCGATCAAGYASGTAVTLTASPAAGSKFAGWSGGGCTGTGSCVLTMSVNTTVTANFTLGTFAIGDRVVALQGVAARNIPSTSGTILQIHATGELGTVVGGPTVADGWTWWNINYDVGAAGWSTEGTGSGPRPAGTAATGIRGVGTGSSTHPTWFAGNGIRGVGAVAETPGGSLRVMGCGVGETTQRHGEGGRAMRKRSVLAAVLVSVLLPIQALAAACFTPSPFPNVLMFEVVGSGGRYYVIAGEDWGACTGSPSTGSMPLQGTAYMRGDGSVEIGLNVLSSDGDAKCNAYAYQGTLHPPDYAGTGFVGFLSGTKVPISFIPAACPVRH